MSDSTIQAREVLDERYIIIDKIAEGGMAEVFEAYDNYLNRPVAIKIMSLELSSNLEAVERFKKEYKSIARLKHRNVVQVYACFEHKNRQCIVLELIKGYTLKDRLLGVGPCTVDELIYYYDSVDKAICEAHENGIIHRDIKPENILISFDGKIRVTDFGVAIMANAQEDDQGGKIIGTSKYMAPEIVQSQSASVRSDVYALGIMLYELLIGTAPFIGKNATLVAIKHVKEMAVLPTKIMPKIPQALENVIMKAIAKDPDQRYQSVADFDADLKGVLNNTCKAHQPRMIQYIYLKQHGIYRRRRFSDKYRFIPWFLSRPLLWAYIIGGICLLILFIGLGFGLGG